ncbi:Uncharacterized protein ChrSV_2845 [Chromobacterium vaccinii]|nr:Uncharacterized protein ChrSW_2845 [Chromobacterium vaccinii]QND90302.1 Uncharacterized protein ChrSV_2845 [Chromobacterium vaccinii]
MEHINSSGYVYNTHIQTEDAMRLLSKAGFDVKKLSIISKGYHGEEHPFGFYSVGDKMKVWGGIGAFWGGLWGLLIAPAIFFLPGLGLMAMAGPVVTALIGALEGVVVIGGLSALGAALTRVGVSAEQAVQYETALKADKYVLVIHGNIEEVGRANAILDGFANWQTV